MRPPRRKARTTHRLRCRQLSFIDMAMRDRPCSTRCTPSETCAPAAEQRLPSTLGLHPGPKLGTSAPHAPVLPPTRPHRRHLAPIAVAVQQYETALNTLFSFVVVVFECPKLRVVACSSYSTCDAENDLVHFIRIRRDRGACSKEHTCGHARRPVGLLQFYKNTAFTGNSARLDGNLTVAGGAFTLTLSLADCAACETRPIRTHQRCHNPCVLLAPGPRRKRAKSDQAMFVSWHPIQEAKATPLLSSLNNRGRNLRHEC